MKQSELKTWQSLIFGIIIGAVILAAIFIISLPDRMTPLIILPTVTFSPFQVYVVGAVKIPGVVQLSRNSRIQDAINASGGVLDDADLAQLNLAALVTDGQKIFVPKIGDPKIQESMTNSVPNSTEKTFISLNSANQKDLEKLPGIGEEKAKAIIIEREKRGRFQSIDELSEISGITQNLINQIRPFLYID
jgi:competence protein ComEA